MRTRHILIVVAIFSISFTSCKKEVEKVETKKEIAVAKLETVSLTVSGMTCQIGCAKKIQSDLSKKEGVTSAKVVFTDSIATVEFDANKISPKDLIELIDGIAGGDLYKASERVAKK